MNDKLVQLYIEGMEKGYLTHWGSWQTYSVPKNYTEELFNEEEKVGSDSSEWKRKETSEWEKAGYVFRQRKLRGL